MTRTDTSRSFGGAEARSVPGVLRRTGFIIFASVFCVMLMMAPRTAWSQPVCPCWSGGVGIDSPLGIAQEFLNEHVATPGPWTCRSTTLEGKRSVAVTNDGEGFSDPDYRKIWLTTIGTTTSGGVTKRNCSIFVYIGGPPTSVKTIMTNAEIPACSLPLRTVCAFINLSGTN